MIDIKRIDAQLQQLAEADYRDFILRLIPGEQNLLGVRMPALRHLAKQLARDEAWADFVLAAPPAASHELVLLQGLTLGYATGGWAEIAPLIEAYLPRIRNWAICDSFVSGLKISRAYPQQMWQLLHSRLDSGQAYQLRFVAVMLLNHYLDAAHLAAALQTLSKISHEDYYVKMAVAWAISAFYLRFPQQVLPFLRQNSLDDFTHNKALQKIGESRLCDADTKKLLQELKR